MTKIVCVGDIHVTDKPPVNATESYTDDIIDMLLWVNGYAQEIGADAIVWAGDIFHHKQPNRTSHALVLKMLRVVDDAKRLGVPLYAVIGNHDISNDVLGSVPEKQPLGVLFAAGLEELSGWHPELPIFGVPWRQDWTTYENSARDAFAEWRERGSHVRRDTQSTTAPSLAITHAPIYPPGEAEKQLFELVPTKGEKGISAAMGNEGFLYYGHIHEDHGIYEVEGTVYANMGAISRGSLTEYNLEREIKVAIWEAVGDYAEFQEVVVPHKPASEVFRMVEAEERKNERLSLDEFLTDVGSTKLDISSTASVIDHIQKLDTVEPRIKKRAIDILENIA